MRSRLAKGVRVRYAGRPARCLLSVNNMTDSSETNCVSKIQMRHPRHRCPEPSRSERTHPKSRTADRSSCTTGRPALAVASPTNASRPLTLTSPPACASARTTLRTWPAHAAPPHAHVVFVVYTLTVTLSADRVHFSKLYLTAMLLPRHVCLRLTDLELLRRLSQVV